MTTEMKLAQLRIQAIQFLINSMSELQHDLEHDLRKQTLERMEDTILDLETEITLTQQWLMTIIK